MPLLGISALAVLAAEAMLWQPYRGPHPLEPSGREIECMPKAEDT
jgi:hypothetical protein